MPRKSPPAPNKSGEKTTPPSASEVYQVLMDSLDLSEDHRQNLLARGLSAQEIKELGYKSFPVKRRQLIDKVVNHFGHDRFEHAEVPGFWRNDRGEFELAGKCGIAIPVRSEDGEIVSVKIRVDKPSKPSTKYLLLSSNPKPDAKTGDVKYPFGSAAKTSIHWPLGRPKSVKILRITEGEVKADIAFSLSNIYTISLPGVGMWKMAIEAIKLLRPDEVWISFDSDKAQSFNAAYDKDQEKVDESTAPGQFLVGKAVSSLYLALKGEMVDMGIKKLSIEDWPGEAGKGIDDVLMGGSSDLIKLLSEDEADKFTQEMMSEGMQEGWCYVIGVKRFYHTKSMIELDKEQFSDRFCHMEKGVPAMNALRNPVLPKVDSPIYMPNREVFYEEGGRKLFNLWRKGSIEPVKGDVSRFMEHAEYVLPVESEREILLDWLAYNVQNPGKKILWAILLQGKQGCGKSYFGSIMRYLLGATNVSMPTNDLIHEPYTAWQKSCQLVVIEEIMARGRLELMNKLKPIITQEITMIREMNKPAYEQPNVFNLLMFTNHEDAIIVDKEDRRYCVFFSPAIPRDHEYYSSLWDWTRASLPAILHFLTTRDISAFLPLAHAPMTAGKKVLIKESMPAVQSWIEECVEGNSWPFMGDIISINHLMSCIPPAIKFITPQGLGKALKSCGCQQIGQILLKSGNTARVWSVRRHEMWASAQKETLAAEYEKWSMAEEPGGNPLLDAKPL